MAALFVFERVVQTFYHCVYSLSSPSLTMHLLIRISMLLISSLQWFFTVFLLLSCFCFWFATLSLSISFSFSLCLFSPVWPGPDHPHPQCMYYYLSFFFIFHHSNFLLLLAVLHHSSCMWMLTQRWFFLLPGDIFQYYILNLVCYPPLTLFKSSNPNSSLILSSVLLL